MGKERGRLAQGQGGHRWVSREEELHRKEPQGHISRAAKTEQRLVLFASRAGHACQIPVQQGDHNIKAKVTVITSQIN